MSNLNIIKGSSNYGYIAYYAYKILSGENINGFYFDENNGEYILTGYLGNETNLILPDNYKGAGYKIGSSAFKGCKLHSMTIGIGVLSIGSNQCQPKKQFG